jgi:hypothetical protein
MELSSSTMVQPRVVEPVIDAYWHENGEEPKIYTIELASKVLALARSAGLDPAAIERLEDIRATLARSLLPCRGSRLREAVTAKMGARSLADLVRMADALKETKAR